MRSIDGARSGGFSLLEMVVAIAILGLSLGALYQSVSGATRIVRSDEKYAYGVELARSLLASHERVPAAGAHDRGETAGGFSWAVTASPLTLTGTDLEPGSLQEIEVVVSWPDGLQRRRVVLNSFVAGIAP